MVGLRPTIAGLTVLLPKVWVVIGDLLVGILSDRTISRWGRRRPYLLAGAVFASVGLVWLFWVPRDLPPSLAAVYVVSAYLVLCTGQSLFGVPYLAMASEISDDPAERTRLLSYRQVCLLGGVFAALAGAPLVTQLEGGGIDGYRRMALGLGLLVGVAMLAPVLMVPSGAARIPAAPLAVLDDFRAVRGNKAFVLVIAANVFQSIATGGSSAAAPYLITLSMGYDFRIFSAFVSLSIVGAIISQPFWVALARHMGTTRSYLVAVAGHGIGLAVFVAHWTGLLFPLLALGFALGVCSAGFSLLLVSLLTDVIRADSIASGNREALLSAFYTMSERVAVALGAFLVAGILSWGGFVEFHGAQVVQTSTALRFVRYSFAGVGAGAQLVTLLLAFALKRAIARLGTSS